MRCNLQFQYLNFVTPSLGCKHNVIFPDNFQKFQGHVVSSQALGHSKGRIESAPDTPNRLHWSLTYSVTSTCDRVTF